MLKSLLSRSIFWVTFLGLGTILAATNPNEATYSKHLAAKLQQQLEDNICREAGFLHSGCLSILKSSQSELTSFIQSGTKRKNLFLFSLYETELFVLPLSPPYQAKAIGIGRHFYTYQEGQYAE
ncbi:MAG: DUF4359 domain-containing protein [Geitlerinemataceae cyanobacterium]